ncbi:uncharacterized protein LOC133795153 [Humulus lupulus]|uniref:uncharacterized protein LOC133795153 n=1 Tax=Humulus lupulus TaxID=3486 RepID=UPI002B406356|nr:uncharacterized protein LOC133795153 [Humulus lupulus]
MLTSTGDFNSVFEYGDRCGGRPVTSSELIDAQRWKGYGLADELRSIDSQFTWTNNQSDGARIYSKLDRIFKNEEWSDLFPTSVAVKQWDILSNHCFCLIKVIQEVISGFKPFRFYNMWVDHDRFKATVLQCWKRSVAVGGFDGILVKLKRLSHVLRRFNKSEIGDVERNFQMAKEKLYDSFLRQKSKINWLKFGDDNTAFFHACLKQRKEVNRIASFVSDNGQLVENYEEVSPSPDGYGSGFFKAMWNEIGDDISTAVLGFFQQGIIPKGLNNALLSLIPKVANPTKAVDYRPIACCNTLYKCISKMMCERLKVVLPLLIHQNQGAFIKDRLLAYNILIFQDILKGYKRKNISPRCVMKINLSKAYDSIDWHYLEEILASFCFPNQFINWNMLCLKDSSYSILMNGRVQGCFTGRRGLKQGDPISPLLFVLVMEFFTRMLIHATQNRDFKFHPRCRRLKLVSLCFADDLVIFCKGNNASVQIIQQCFKDFSAASGLTANLEKSRVYFGGLTETETKIILKDLHFAEGEFPLKYLGVPLRPTKWRVGDCANIIQKIQLKLHHWSNRHLSFAGKAQLIHSVLLGIRAFWMSIFLLPKSVINEIDHLCRRFLWGTSRWNENRSKFHITAWDQVCLPKHLGGIGFRDGTKWNMVLLAKYIWAVSTKQDILWVKWVDVVYLKGQSIWDYNLQTDVSWYWRKLIKLRSVINGEMLEKVMVQNKLKTSKLYSQLVNTDKVPFAHVVWCNLTLPKHRFILWQASLGHLLTRDNLLRCHLQLASTLCPICELQQECHEHLFFQCQFSQQVRNRVASWLGREVSPVHYHGWIEWMKGKPKGIQQKVFAAGLAASVYLVWWNRNQCMFNYFSVSVNKAIAQLQDCLKTRVSSVSKAKLKSKDLVFLKNLNLL